MRRALAARAGVLAGVVTVLVVLAACSGTTIISEGTLGSPPTAQSPGAPPDDAGGGSDQTDTEPPDRQSPEQELPALVEEAQLASLAEDCEAGSDPACDILFQVSAAASPEEELARNCGGREPAGDGFCTDGIRSSPDGIWFDESSPGLAALERDCRAGDGTTCDFLYIRSAVGSAYEELGLSCGGRVEVAVPDCRTALAD